MCFSLWPLVVESVVNGTATLLCGHGPADILDPRECTEQLAGDLYRARPVGL